MYMLDTNICIYIIKKRPLSVLNRFSTIPRDEICISVVTLAELRYGVEKSSSKKFNQRILDDFLLRLTVLYWDENTAMQYGKTRAFLEKKGLPIGEHGSAHFCARIEPETHIGVKQHWRI